ncbi:MAG TPA: S8 family serine peptidase [Chloroflexota bacterium]
MKFTIRPTRGNGVSAFCALTLLLSTVLGSAGALAKGADAERADQVIVRLRDAADLPAIASEYRLDPLPLDRLPLAPLYLMHIADGADPDARAAALAADGRVAYAEPNFVGAVAEDSGDSSWASGDSSWASGFTEANYLGQWAPQKLRLATAFTATRGAGVTVAVLDTGLDATHPSLASHLVSGYDFVDNDADPSEVGAAGPGRAYGHGTFIAGLVLLAAPEARILPVRVLDQDGVGDVWRLAKGLVWAADPDGNPATRDGADVINMSLGTVTHTHLTNDLVSGLAFGGRGIVMVAAAGNFGSRTPMFPAAEGGSRVLSVGASTPLDTLASFSNSGSWVRVQAPGVSLLSSVPGGGFGAASGTSMASALAAGEAALVRAANPALKAQDVIQRIANSAVKLPGGVPPRVDAAAALGR